MGEKAASVMKVMQERLDGLQVGWGGVSAINVYTVHPIHSYLIDIILVDAGDAASHGVHWHFGHPPIQGLAYEMDLHGVVRSEVLRPKS